LSRTVTIHVREFSAPDCGSAVLVDRAVEVFAEHGIRVQVDSSSVAADSTADLRNPEVGACNPGSLSSDQEKLFQTAGDVAEDHVVVFLVRSTSPPVRGCAAHPPDRPGLVVSSLATEWTLAHELGHVMGLDHVFGQEGALMRANTSRLTSPPIPSLSQAEVAKAERSPVVASLKEEAP
jgi:hypothetical protein